MCFLFKPKTRRCYNELTADRSGAGRTVVHGAGVGPFLSIGCSFIAPLLQGAEERGAITHAATTAYTAENLQGLSGKSVSFTDMLREGEICNTSSCEICYHFQHVASSRLNTSSQGIVLVHNRSLIGGGDQDGA